ncbi:uncharacterized protein LOC129769741 [Toxorhynchites rutilus septentrionalis]|uniref:uncharacterized protein LOC129769741 n=1 Tax=Toxorhynchites rutilus septentrionalis TaxID=329112 RepID=UPI00247A8066|nr:uncharacterized protein LOC129769741 [Toxorhynchites rutilus septentrionalis]
MDFNISNKTKNNSSISRKKPSKSQKAKLATQRLLKLRRKTFPTHKIPQSKLKKALDFLESKPEPEATTEPRYPMCFGNIAYQVSTSRWVNNFMSDTQNVMRVACQCAERGQWTDFMKTVQILCEDPRFYDMHAALRNAFFGIIADPSLDDRSFLESYLYSNPRCKNPGDVEYCISKILEVFQGIMIKSNLRSKEDDDD